MLSSCLGSRAQSHSAAKRHSGGRMRSVSLVPHLRAGLCWTSHYLAAAAKLCSGSSMTSPSGHNLTCCAASGDSGKPPVGRARAPPRRTATVPVPRIKQQPASLVPPMQLAPQQPSVGSQQAPQPQQSQLQQPQQAHVPQQQPAASSSSTSKIPVPRTARQRLLQELVSARQDRREKSGVATYPIVGVTFEGRQEHVAQLEEGQAVYCIKEPTNAYDPCAIRVETLAGVHLGYIGRNYTDLFNMEYTSGFVVSKGQASSGAWGATIQVYPMLQPLTLDPLPELMASIARLDEVLPPEKLESLLTAPSARCKITGLTPTAAMPLEAVPVWRYDLAEHRIALVDCFAAAAPVADATRVFEATNAQDKEERLQLLMDLQHWRREDLEMYLPFVAARLRAITQDVRAGVEWQVDLCWATRQ